MRQELFVSAGDGIGVLSLSGARLRHAKLHAAGALCVHGDHVFCAGQDGAIWRLDRESLMPQALHPGGPGVCDLEVSRDGRYLYALCGDADSVLLSEIRSAGALVLARAGCNPQHMALDGNTLAIAGGESGCVHLLSAQTLESLADLFMPGPVYSVLLRGGMVHALCLTQTLSSVLVSVQRGGARHMVALVGMPGRLLWGNGCLLAATQGFVYLLSEDGSRLLSCHPFAGRGVQLAQAGNTLYLRDILGERLCVFGMDGCVRPLYSACRAFVLA